MMKFRMLLAVAMLSGSAGLLSVPAAQAQNAGVEVWRNGVSVELGDRASRGWLSARPREAACASSTPATGCA